MKRLLILLAAVFWFFTEMSVVSAYELDITFDKDVYNVGDTIEVDVSFLGLSNDSNNIYLWAFDLAWDPLMLQYQYDETVHNPDWTIQGTSDGLQDVFTYDSYGFTGGMEGTPRVGLTGDPLYLVTAQFEVLQVGDGELNMVAGDRSSGDNFQNTSGAGLDSQIVFYEAGGSDSATIVPVPGALILMGSGLLSLVGIRRRKG